MEGLSFQSFKEFLGELEARAYLQPEAYVG